MDTPTGTVVRIVVSRVCSSSSHSINRISRCATPQHASSVTTAIARLTKKNHSLNGGGGGQPTITLTITTRTQKMVSPHRSWRLRVQAHKKIGNTKAT